MMITIIIFTICSLINVMLNTVKTIVMYKKNILSSALVNAVTYGFYTVIVVLMAGGEMPLGWKILLTALTNFIGVALSMMIMKKLEKDKLWKVEATVIYIRKDDVCEMLNKAKVPYNYIDGVGKYTLFNIFCSTQKQSAAVKEILKAYEAKYFVSESKTL